MAYCYICDESFIDSEDAIEHFVEVHPEHDGDWKSFIEPSDGYGIHDNEGNRIDLDGNIIDDDDDSWDDEDD